MDERIAGWVNGRMGTEIDKRMNGWEDGQMAGMDR